MLIIKKNNWKIFLFIALISGLSLFLIFYCNGPQAGFLGNYTSNPAIIWFHNAATTELNTLTKAVSNSIITHVWIIHLHPHDVKLQDILLQTLKAASICKKNGVKIIWARALWPSYEVKNLRKTILFDSNYYKNFIDEILEEARIIGAEFTGVDTEPYAFFPYKDIKKIPLSRKEFIAVKQAVESAVSDKGKIDFLMPASGASPTHIYNALLPLAKLRIAEDTYYDIPSKLKEKNRPFDVFGAYVNVSKENPKYPKAPFFTLREILVERRNLWRHKEGLMLYPKEDKINQLAEMLSRIGSIEPAHKLRIK